MSLQVRRFDDLQDQRVCLRDLFDRDGRNSGGEFSVQRLDECICEDGISGVSRMYAVEREQTTQKLSGEQSPVDLPSMRASPFVQ